MKLDYSPIGWVEFSVWHVMRCLPTRVVSALGWLIGLAHYPIYSLTRAGWIDNIHAAFASVGENGERSRLQVARYFANVGQVQVESAVLDRYMTNGLLTIEGGDAASDPERPTIFVGSHMANWELIAIVAAKLGIPGNILYWPLNDPVRRDIANKVRAGITGRTSGTRLVASTPHAMRTLTRAVSRGENLLIFADEQKDGIIWTPRLGRDIADQGNRYFIARLAVRYGARVVPVFVRRTGLGRYHCTIEPALELPASGEQDARVRSVASAIDARIAHRVREHPEQWYWMGELIDPRGWLVDGPRSDQS